VSLKHIIKDNPEYFRELYNRYHSLLVRFAWGILYDHEEAKDIVQEVFLDLWNKTVEIPDECTLKAFLFTCTRNKALNRIKKLRIIDKHQDQAKEALLFTYRMDAHTEEDLRRISEILGEMPVQMQNVVTLHAIKGLKYTEIAGTLGVSVNTVKTHLKRAYQKLRKEMLRGRSWIICFLSFLRYFI
jgi:RNA polymerase sigma-70 factor (ECF subfamily)